GRDDVPAPRGAEVARADVGADGDDRREREQRCDEACEVEFHRYALVSRGAGPRTELHGNGL
ncbi:MAG: hypothetical protein KDD53_10290, partial [Bdellovibrionales bacterium]|nr:hypothetical protein [Bdellovibrionales bacterium]